MSSLYAVVADAFEEKSSNNKTSASIKNRHTVCYGLIDAIWIKCKYMFQHYISGLNRHFFCFELK